MTENRRNAGKSRLLPYREPGTNPLPYDMAPNPGGITPLGWSILTEAEARELIAAAARLRGVSQEDRPSQ